MVEMTDGHGNKWILADKFNPRAPAFIPGAVSESRNTIQAQQNMPESASHASSAVPNPPQPMSVYDRNNAYSSQFRELSDHRRDVAQDNHERKYFSSPAINAPAPLPYSAPAVTFRPAPQAYQALGPIVNPPPIYYSRREAINFPLVFQAPPAPPIHCPLRSAINPHPIYVPPRSASNFPPVFQAPPVALTLAMPSPLGHPFGGDNKNKSGFGPNGLGVFRRPGGPSGIARQDGQGYKGDSDDGSQDDQGRRGRRAREGRRPDSPNNRDNQGHRGRSGHPDDQRRGRQGPQGDGKGREDGQGIVWREINW